MIGRIMRNICVSGVLLGLLVVLFVSPSTSYAQTITKVCSNVQPCSIFWAANTEPDIDKYKLYLRKLPTVFQPTRVPLITVVHPQTALSQTVFMGLLTNLGVGDYGLIATALDKTGNESVNSNEIFFTFQHVDKTPPLPLVLQLFQIVVP